MKGIRVLAVSIPGREEDQQRGGPEENGLREVLLADDPGKHPASDLPCGPSLFSFCPGLLTLLYHSPPLPLGESPK